MPANLRTCADCSTQYAVDLPACPHCGSSNTVDEEGAATVRLPLYVTVSCPDCDSGPWTLRLGVVRSGLIELPTLACASCGSRVPVTWPPEEEPMSPKITVHGGATNAREADLSPAADASKSPQVVAEDDLGRTNTVEAKEAVGGALPELPAEAYGEDATPLDSDDSNKAGDDGGSDSEPEPDPYAGMSLAELRAEADKQGVPSYGSKAQVAERLREAAAAAAGNAE